MTEIQPLDPQIQAELDRLGLSEYSVGDLVIESGHGGICRIDGIFIGEEWYDNAKQMMLQFTLTYGAENHHYGTVLYTEFVEPRKRYYRLYDTPENLTAEGIKALMLPEREEELSSSTAITTSASPDRMKMLMRQKEKVADRAMILRLMVERKLAGLEHEYSRIMRQVRYMGRVIELLQTFLGVYEQIITIREGAPAPIETPITIRQLILYADEEVGSVDEQDDGQIGIDFKNIEELDVWLLEDERHLTQMLPEIKGVVAIRPSRQWRHYSDDPYQNAAMQKENNHIYLLIRNGERVSRVWANMQMGGKDRLFPSSEEMEAITEELTQSNLSEEHELHLKHKELDWRQNAVLIEGLFERTDLFQPTPNRITLFERGPYERGELVMIRDAEQNTLPDGAQRPRYDDWHRQLNAELGRGSRILLAQPDWDSDKYGSRYFLNTSRRYTLPHPGVYGIDSVERRNERDVEVANNWYYGEQLFDDGFPYRNDKIGTHTEHHYDEYLTFLYMPPGEHVWTWQDGYHEREKRVRFFVQRNDWFVLNYDRISLSDVRYYINNRLERRHYQKILPTLFQIRKERLAERRAEQPFVNLIVNELGCTEAQVWDAIEWWKYKVISHRAIAEDDAKAWRMIRKRIQNPTYLDKKEESETHE